MNPPMVNPAILVPLSLVQAKRSVLLHRIRGGGGLSAHLAAMGLIPGTTIKVCRNDHRGPVLIGIQENRLALGRGMAAKIAVEEITA